MFKKIVTIWAAIIGPIWLVVILAVFFNPTAPTQSATVSAPVSTPATQQAKTRENKLIGCKLLLTAAAANLRDLNAECNDSMLTWDDPLRCLMVGAVLHNRNFGKPELSSLPPNTQASLLKACWMLIHGVDEKVADYAAKDAGKPIN